jgi:hypothetical protein
MDKIANYLLVIIGLLTVIACSLKPDVFWVFVLIGAWAVIRALWDAWQETKSNMHESVLERERLSKLTSRQRMGYDT